MKARSCNLKTRPAYPKQVAACSKQATACYIRRPPVFEQNKQPPVITGARVFQIKENKVVHISNDTFLFSFTIPLLFTFNFYPLFFSS